MSLVRLGIIPYSLFMRLRDTFFLDPIFLPLMVIEVSCLLVLFHCCWWRDMMKCLSLQKIKLSNDAKLEFLFRYNISLFSSFCCLETEGNISWSTYIYRLTDVELIH